MVRIKTTAFTDLKDSDFLLYAQSTANAVASAGTLFAGISPANTVMQDAISDLAGKAAAAKDGSSAQKDERDVQRAVVTAYLFQWAGFVMTLANTKPNQEERLAIISAAAFTATVRGGRIGPLGAVENVRAKSLSQAACLEWDTLKGAHSYRVVQTPGYANEESVWTEAVITTRAKATLPAGPGSVMTYIIYPIGTAGQGQPSEPVTVLTGL